jgi:hypothetical protein
MIEAIDGDQIDLAGKSSQARGAYRHQGKREEKNLIWTRRNPLKSPDSAKGIQTNPSVFAWFSLA